MNCYVFCFFKWRTKLRETMNMADNDASTRVIDSLINYEVSISVINASFLMLSSI